MYKKAKTPCPVAVRFWVKKTCSEAPFLIVLFFFFFISNFENVKKKPKHVVLSSEVLGQKDTFGSSI